MVKQGKRFRKGPLVKHKRTPNPKVLKKLALAIVITIVAAGIYIKVQPHTYDAKQQVKLQNTYQQLQKTKQDYEKSKVQDTQSEQKIQQLNQQLQDVQKQLQAKKASAIAYAAEPAPNVVAGCGDNTYANYIYSHESGCSTDSINAGSGACGIGQALPCTKLPCSLSDYTCQNTFFTAYAMARYGSWANAYDFWVANHYW